MKSFLGNFYRHSAFFSGHTVGALPSCLPAYFYHYRPWWAFSAGSIGWGNRLFVCEGIINLIEFFIAQIFLIFFHRMTLAAPSSMRVIKNCWSHWYSHKQLVLSILRLSAPSSHLLGKINVMGTFFSTRHLWFPSWLAILTINTHRREECCHQCAYQCLWSIKPWAVAHLAERSLLDNLIKHSTIVIYDSIVLLTRKLLTHITTQIVLMYDLVSFITSKFLNQSSYC